MKEIKIRAGEMYELRIPKDCVMTVRVERNSQAPARGHRVSDAPKILAKVPKYLRRCRRENVKPTVRGFTKTISGHPKSDLVTEIINASDNYIVIRDGRANIIREIDIL